MKYCLLVRKFAKITINLLFRSLWSGCNITGCLGLPTNVKHVWHVPHIVLHTMIISSLLLYSRFLTSFLCVSIPLCPQQMMVALLHSNGQLRTDAHLSATKPPSFATSCSIWIILVLVGLPFILPSIISCKSLSCLKTWPSILPLQNRVLYLPVFV